MFTGIIQEQGTVKNIKKDNENLLLEIYSEKVLKDCKRGDSISVNGVCLTISQLSEKGFQANVMVETFNKTNLKELKMGTKVNLEKSLTLSTLMGGHLVYGHVDNIGKVKKVEKVQQYWKLTLETEKEVLKYIIAKASVAINGVSLTVGEVSVDDFTIYLIPTTIEDTNLSYLEPGNIINIEVDMLAKYVYHYVNKTEKTYKISEEFLRDNGF